MRSHIRPATPLGEVDPTQSTPDAVHEGAPLSNHPGSRVRVLCVGRDLGGGGAERVQLTLLTHLDRHRFDLRLFYLRNEGPLHHLIPGDLTPDYGAEATESLKTRGLGVLATLRRLARHTDVLFALQDGTPIYLSILAGRLAHRPVVGWIHNTWTAKLKHVPSWHRPASALLYPLGTSFIGVSNGVATDLTTFAPRLRHKTVVIPSPVALSHIRSDAEDPIPPWAQAVFTKPTLLAVGRLVPAKGFDILLQAFHGVLRAGFDFHLLILGEGKERSSLETQARALGIATRVFLPGFQANPYPYFKRAKMFVLSSRYEGLAMVLLEALALGVPVVSADCPSGPRELLDHGQNGVLFPSEDATALSNALCQLASRPDDEMRYRTLGPAQAALHDASRVTVRFEQILLAAHEARPAFLRRRAVP
jgi:glycosyltransferase involved in cell wall biosynthesis